MEKNVNKSEPVKNQEPGRDESSDDESLDADMHELLRPLREVMLADIEKPGGLRDRVADSIAEDFDYVVDESLFDPPSGD